MTAKELLKAVIDECYESGSGVSFSIYTNVGADILFWDEGYQIVDDIRVRYSDIPEEQCRAILQKIKQHKEKSQSKGLATD